jgi:hypothetical protein
LTQFSPPAKHQYQVSSLNPVSDSFHDWQPTYFCFNNINWWQLILSLYKVITSAMLEQNPTWFQLNLFPKLDEDRANHFRK